MKTLGIYIWYFFAESEIFPKILIAVSLVIFGMFLERAWLDVERVRLSNCGNCYWDLDRCIFRVMALVQGCWNELKKRAISTAMLTAQG